MRLLPLKAVTNFFFIIVVFLGVVSVTYLYSQEQIIQDVEHVIKYNPVLTPAITRGNNSGGSSSLQALPHQHVYYLKTHKTGSTTMFAIFGEYARAHDLLPLMPSAVHFNQGGRLLEKQVMLASNVVKYDMAFSHHIYSPNMFNFLHNDTYKITSLREPFSNFVSAFLYYRNRFRVYYLTQVQTKDPLTEFLRHPKKYENRGYGSFTNNRQSMDMGYDLNKGFENMDYVKQFIQESDRRFDLVLIMEYFDEGLVLMKRALRWNTEDILYLTKNIGRHYKETNATQDLTELENEQKQLHAKFSQPDIMLYDHFLQRFKDQMAKEVSLQEEVAEFREILIKFQNVCNGLEKTNENVVIPPGKFNNGIQVTRFKCKMLESNFKFVTNYLKTRQKQLFP